MDTANAECFVERGQELCLLALPNCNKVSIYLDQDWIGEICPGTNARFRFDHQPHSIVEGKVTNIVGEVVQDLPAALVANRMLTVTKDGAGNPISAEPVFRIDCELAAQAHILPGSTGTVSFWITDKTVGQRLAQFVHRTFRIDW